MYLLGLLEFVLIIVALVDVITRSEHQIRYLPKVAWVLLVIFIPLLGAVLWFVLGRSWDHEPRNHGRYVEPAHISPDRHAYGDARISATERELAALDDEIAFWNANRPATDPDPKG